MARQKIKQGMLVLLYGISGLLFVLSICTDRLVFGLLGMPFFLLAVSVIHELGHAVGCAINKNVVTSIRTALFTIEKRRVSVNEELRFGGHCAFLKSENDALVYLCGPLASLVCFLACLGWWLGTRPSTTALLCMLVTGLHVLKNGVPHGHNDLRLFLKELTKGDSK